ncbi:probable transposase for insertion sequence element ISRM3-like [Trichonephila clavata]|uniref:Probable transposase for insertion sequence element ISRM3-like n=1 Tax=Trichonephila clavata TaxID=2740835 RepID=A0A8X6I1L8_TRICU|nr:probable transposase for insertion sequence element ISRM3-like [Trichonephila clavata]
MEAVWYIVRSGCQWRLLPRIYGNYRSIHRRFKKWCEKGILAKLLKYVQQDPDLEISIIDGTIIRSHPCSAGYRKDSQAQETLGRSKGGFTTKIHALVDALGNPLKFILTPGQRNEITQASVLTKNVSSSTVVADKGYDSNAFIACLESKGCSVVIPPKRNRKKVVNRTTGLVDYKELETNILSSIREGRPLTGRDGALTPFIKKLLEASLEGEIENHLLAESEENNRRNGRNGKTLRTSAGSFELLTPRDREGSFEPQIVKKRQTNLHPELETKILSTFASGMGYRDIASHVEEIYDHKISAAEISSITDKLLPIINEWRSRPLQSVYPIVFMDGMFFKVKEDGHCVSKCMYNILGIDQNGRKEVLGFYLAESEGANFWLGVLNDLKERGVEDILIACVDGLKSFPAAINSAFPKAEVQLCIVHQIRNSLKYVSSKDVKVFMNDLKKIYRATSKEIAENYLLELEEKWGEKYQLVVKSWQNNWENLSGYFKYSGPVRKLIYTTNHIEGLHRQIRKFTKTKGSFTSLYKQVYCAIKKAEEKWTMPISDWALTISQLDIFFPARLKIELN